MPESDPLDALIPVQRTPVVRSAGGAALPAIVRRGGRAAVFAAEEFFYGSIRNEHTRAAYRRAINS